MAAHAADLQASGPVYPPFFGPAPNADLLRPATLDEALGLLAAHGDRAAVMAGGTSLTLAMRRRIEAPEVVVYIGDLAELRFIRTDSDGLHIGPLVTHNQLAASPHVRERAPILARAAAQIAGPAVRNLATVGGNVARGYDLAPPLLALDARLTLRSPRGQRTLPLAEFYLGPAWNALQPDELITDILVPTLFPAQGLNVVRRRKANDFAIAQVAVVLDVDGDGLCRDVRVGIGFGFGVTFPVRATRAEAELRGRRLEQPLIERAAAVLAEESNPPDDGHASAWYRRKVIGVCFERALNQALGRPII
jgi:carbon-monoxide dehydrogenase medium subunit